jgi:hypothetical protein
MTAMNTPTNQFPDLPDTFDLAELKGVFSDEEIRAMAEGDDPMVTLPDPDAAPPEPDATLDAQNLEAVAAAQQAQAAAIAAQKPVAPEPESDIALIEVPDTAAAQAVLDAQAQKIDEIQQKYDDGDMTKAEMAAALSKLADEQAAARQQIREAEQVIQQAQAQANDKWNSTLEGFKAAGNEALWSPDHVQGFDAQLRQVTAKAGELGLRSFESMIRLAARNYAAAYEERTGQALRLAHFPGQKPAQQQKAEPRRDPRPDAPQLLGGLNGDGGMAQDDGTFAAIDRAATQDPFEAERLLSRLSAQDLEKYLSLS